MFSAECVAYAEGMATAGASEVANGFIFGFVAKASAQALDGGGGGDVDCCGDDGGKNDTKHIRLDDEIWISLTCSNASGVASRAAISSALSLPYLTE